MTEIETIGHDEVEPVPDTLEITLQEQWRTFCDLGQRTVGAAWDFGNTLNLIKRTANHGNFGGTLSRIGISKSQAHRYMKLARETQKKDTFIFVSVTEALKSLAKPKPQPPLEDAKDSKFHDAFEKETDIAPPENTKNLAAEESPFTKEEIDAESRVMAEEEKSESQKESIESAYNRDMDEISMDEYDADLEQWILFHDRMTRNERAVWMRKKASEVSDTLNHLKSKEKLISNIRKSLRDGMTNNEILGKHFGVAH